MARHNDVAADCNDCGKTSGYLDTSGATVQIRCGDCGRFASKADNYCAKHEVDLDRLPSGYSSCPRCQQERDVEARRQEMMARRADPNMHPTVDAPRR